MPNTYGGAISQGISQGLGNVSAMYGLQNQMRQSQREDELYNIKMKEYQKGLEPADWGKIGNFLDAGEEGLGYAKAYAGALGKDPDKMTRSDMREFGEIFLKDQKAAHDILQFRRRHYGQKVKEYEGKPGLESEYGMFKEKFDQATMLDKTYREAQSFRQEQEQIQKATQAMQKVASMSDEELSLKGYPPIMRDMAASGDIQGFRSIAGKIAEAQVKPPTEFERYKNMTPAERKEYDEFKGAGKKEQKSATEWNLLERAQKGDKEAIAILDSKEKRDLRIKEKEKEIGGLPNIGSIPTTPPGVKNPAALEGLSPGEAAVVKQLADYKVQLPSGMALRTPYWQGILERASLYDSSFDATQYNVRLGVRKDFTSGKAALNIRSLNTAVHHLNTLVDSAQKLENSPVQLWNAISNKGLTAVGDPRVTNFLNAATAIEGELANVFKNTGATDQEIKSWRENLNTSFSPAQLRGAMNTVIKLLSGRLAALRNQYEVGMGRPKDFRILSGDSLKIIQGLGIDPNTVDPIGAQSGTEGLNIDRNAIEAELRRRGL